MVLLNFLIIFIYYRREFGELNVYKKLCEGFVKYFRKYR